MIRLFDRALLSIGPLLLCSLAASAQKAGPLIGGDTIPPVVTITPGTETTGIGTFTVSVDWCDNASLIANSRSIILNAVNVTSTFTYVTSTKVGCGAHATSTGTVTLIGGTNSLTASIVDNGPNGGSSSVTYTYPIFLNVSTAANNEDDQNVNLCTMSCFTVKYSQATVAHISMDLARSVGLVYDGDRIAVRPFIFSDVSLSTGAPAISEFWLQAKINSGSGWTTVTFLNGDQTLRFTGNQSQTVRLAGQFDASAYATGAYPFQIITTAKYANGQLETHTDSSQYLLVVNAQRSSIGRGWTVAGVPRIVAPSIDSVVVVEEGDGSAEEYLLSGAGDTAYTSPNGEYRVLTRQLNLDGSVRSWTRASPDSTKEVFTNLGELASRTDRFGIQMQFAWDSVGRLETISDPYLATYGSPPKQRTFTLQYGSKGLQAIVEPGMGPNNTGGRTTLIGIGADSTLQSITDPDGRLTRFSYDSVRRLVRVIDRRSDTTRYTYQRDQSWKADSLILASIPLDAGGGTTTSGHIVRLYRPWQTIGVPVSSTATSPATPVLTSTVRGITIDGLGRPTRMSVNRWGQPLSVSDSLGDVTTINRLGTLATTITRPTGATDTLLYQAGTDRVIYTHTAGDSAVHYLYGAAAQIDSAWGPGVAAQRRFLSSANGRIDSVRYYSSSAFVVRFQYNNFGQLVSTTDWNNHLTTYHYDSLFANQDSVAVAGGYALRVRFDAFGRDTAIRTTADSYWWRHISYDTINRPIKTWHSGRQNDTTFTSYDGLFAQRIVTPGGRVHRVALNALGWTTRRYDDVDTTKFVETRYDRGGRITGTTNRRGQAVTETYDVLDRLLTRSGDNTPSDTFTYSPNGRIIAAVRKNVSRDSTFLDANGGIDSLVRRIAGHRYRIGYAWSTTPTRSVSHLTIVNDASARFVTDSEVSILAALHDSVFAGSSATGLSLSTGGITTQQIVGATFPAAFSYTARGFPYWIIASEGAGAVHDSLSRSAQYDSANRVILDYRDTGSGSVRWRFAYDSVGRLLVSRREVGSACSFGEDSIFGMSRACTAPTSVTSDSAVYDVADNRLGTGATYGPGDRLAAWQGVTYTYDADGNVVTRAHGGVIDSLFWSSMGWLDSVASGGSNGLRTRYEYNSDGQLVRRSHNSVVDRYFLWEQSRLLAELNATGGRRAQYLYYNRTGEPYAIATDSATTTLVRYLLTDFEGNVIGVFGKQGTGTKLFAFTPFTPWGSVDSPPVFNALGDTLRLQWKGLLYEGDSTRLYMTQTRWYDPQARRFASEDPIGLVGGVNPYVFAGDDPVNGSDPTGLDGQCPDKTVEIEEMTDEYGNTFIACARNGGDDNPIIIEVLAPVTVVANSSSEPIFPTTGVFDLGNGMRTDYSTNIGPGVYLGAYRIPYLGGLTHVAIALVPPKGKPIYAELCGWFTCFREQTGFENQTLYGTENYQWTGIAGPDAIPEFEVAIEEVMPLFNGLIYRPPDSNYFVYDVLSLTNTYGSPANKQTLGCAPGLTCFP